MTPSCSPAYQVLTNLTSGGNLNQYRVFMTQACATGGGRWLATAGRRHLRLHTLQVHRPAVRVAHAQPVLVAIRVHRWYVIVLWIEYVLDIL